MSPMQGICPTNLTPIHLAHNTAIYLAVSLELVFPFISSKYVALLDVSNNTETVEV